MLDWKTSTWSNPLHLSHNTLPTRKSKKWSTQRSEKQTGLCKSWNKRTEQHGDWKLATPGCSIHENRWPFTSGIKPQPCRWLCIIKIAKKRNWHAGGNFGYSASGICEARSRVFSRRRIARSRQRVKRHRRAEIQNFSQVVLWLSIAAWNNPVT